MSGLIHLIYNSAATVSFTDADLATLLAGARNKNAAANITGMLLYVNGSFFQVLEGPEESVDAIAAVIAKDTRHTRMSVIIREPIAQRSFSAWTMGFTRMSDADARQIEGLNDFFTDGRVLTELDSGRAKKLLSAFQQGRWRVRLDAPYLPPAQEPAMPATEPAVPQARPLDEPRPDFTFAFQPIVNVSERRIVGHEALIRGNDQETAAQVLQRVPLNEIDCFDADARRMAIGMASRLNMKGNLHLNVTPNVAAADAGWIDSTLDTAKRCGIEPSRLVFELKHESTISDATALGARLRAARARGIRLSIDDFGSGHAGLALLDHYQPELISLSMWLVRGIESHGPRQAILRGLVQTCGDLGIDIVAKGVETMEEYQWLRDEGIELFQGHLIARPGFQTLPRAVLPAEAL